jgi:hypothetical protein
VVQSSVQIDRWNCITCMKVKIDAKQTTKINVVNQFLPPITHSQGLAVIKIIQHVPRKFLPNEFHDLTSYWVSLKKKCKNVKQQACHKLTLPPLPLGTKSNPYNYYNDFYQINLHDPKIRQQYYCYHIPNYKQ